MWRAFQKVRVTAILAQMSRGARRGGSEKSSIRSANDLRHGRRKAKGSRMSGKTYWQFAQLMGATALVATLAACNQDGGLVFPGGDASADTPQSVQLVEHDVEAPDAFQYTGEGLWDGRPSLGGVWVAHPDVTDPERVIIRNQANGKFVIGALFRRERETPGPALQVSSDAADALGMLAGAPATLERHGAAPRTGGSGGTCGHV